MKKIILPFLCIFIIFINGCAHLFKPAQEVTDVERMFKDYDAAWASHDVEKIASFFTDDCIYEDVASGVVSRGKEELKAFIKTTLAAFPDFKVEMKSFFVAGDWVGSEWIMTGTRTGPSPNLPATKNIFSIRGASITELQEGKINRNSDYWNMTSFLHQIGLMPND
jgi:steroid delta-isomerase-like uncharacterized protein